MKINVQVANDGVIIIEGLQSAKESRVVAHNREQRYLEGLAKEKFFERTLKGLIWSINRASERGELETRVSGYGDAHSPLRSNDPQEFQAMEKIIKNQIFSVLRQQGYVCGLARDTFASGEQFFTIKIYW